MTRTGAASPDTRQVGRLAVPVCVGIATSSIMSLHIVASGVVDPVRQPLSDYATVPVGYLFVGLACAAIAVAATLLGTALLRAGLPRARVVRVLLGTWSAALLVVAAFPTNVPGTPPDLAAAVHRVAATWVLAALPLAGWLAGQRSRTALRWAPSARAVLRWSAVAALLGGAFAAAHLPAILGAAPYPLLGVLERGLYLAVVGLLLVLVRAARLAAEPAFGSPADELPEFAA